MTLSIRACTYPPHIKAIKIQQQQKHPQLIIHSHHRLHLLQYSNCASDLSGRSIESSANYQPMWTESFISTNTACQLTRHNFTPPLNPCVCVCHGASSSVSLNVCGYVYAGMKWMDLISPTFTYVEIIVNFMY